jgi:hypothetical protein
VSRIKKNENDFRKTGKKSEIVFIPNNNVPVRMGLVLIGAIYSRSNGYGKGAGIRDVNGVLKPDYLSGIPLLGLGYGLKLIPMGIDLGEILSLSGMADTGLGGLNPNPITHAAVLPDLLQHPGFNDKTCTKRYFYLLVGVSRPGGSLSRRVSVPRAPAQMGRARGRARRGEGEVAGDGRERGGNPAAFVFVPRPGRVRLQ